MNYTSVQQLIVSNTRIIRILLCIFFSVGISGFIYPPTSLLLISLIPYILVGNFIMLILFDESQISYKQYLVFSVIFLVGLGIEIIGVSTKAIFGNYSYGNSLGVKVFDTPLLIGMNWLFLIYTTRLVFQNFKMNEIFKILGASTTMIVYDYFLEHSAHKMDMWYWEHNIIPLQNYISWFIVSVALHSLVSYSKLIIKNKIANTILIIQSVFFIILYFGL